MKLIKMLPAMGFVIAAALVALTSAFKEAPKAPAGSFFYQYNGDPSDPSQATDITKYNRVDVGCSDNSGDLCGIFLSNDAAPGANPSATDFDPHQTDLANSVSTGVSQEQNVIEMRSE